MSYIQKYAVKVEKDIPSQMNVVTIVRKEGRPDHGVCSDRTENLLELDKVFCRFMESRVVAV